MRTPVKTFLIVTWILLCCAVTWLAGKCKAPRAKWWVIQSCYRGLLRIIGVRYTVKGAVSSTRPLLLVTNHTTYLDICVLGAELPVRHTPKSDIGSWPVIGSICRLTSCVFIDRRAAKTADNGRALHAALEEGGIVCLFPEGTTGDGRHVLPFRSSYFSLAEQQFGGKPLLVQPASVKYTHICGMPIDSAQRHLIAWYGDMELVPHVAELLRLGPIRAELTFLDPVDISRFAGRKALAAYCHDAIAAIN